MQKLKTVFPVLAHSHVIKLNGYEAQTSLVTILNYMSDLSGLFECKLTFLTIGNIFFFYIYF